MWRCCVRWLAAAPRADGGYAPALPVHLLAELPKGPDARSTDEVVVIADLGVVGRMPGVAGVRLTVHPQGPDNHDHDPASYRAMIVITPKDGR